MLKQAVPTSFLLLPISIDASCSDSKSRGRKAVRVRPPPPAPSFLLSNQNGVTVHASRYYIGSHQTQAGGRPTPCTPLHGKAHRNTFQKITSTSEGVLYPMGHKVVGAYPPPRPYPPRGLYRGMYSCKKGTGDHRRDNEMRG